METLKVTFVKRKDEHNIYKPAYFNSWAQIIVNPNDFFTKPGIITAAMVLVSGYLRAAVGILVTLMSTILIQ